MGEALQVLAREALTEVTADPLRFIAEALQSLLVIAAVAWFGARMARRRLGERHDMVVKAIEAADAAEQETVRMETEAAGLLETARAAAVASREAAVAGAAKLRAEAEARASVDAAAVIEQARRAVEEDRARIPGDADERIARLTIDVARRYLEEVLDEQQRRALTHRVITEFLEGRDAAEPAGRAG